MMILLVFKVTLITLLVLHISVFVSSKNILNLLEKLNSEEDLDYVSHLNNINKNALILFRLSGVISFSLIIIGILYFLLN